MATENQIWKKTIEELTNKGRKRLFVFGAGKGGKSCLQIFQQAGICARCVDNNETLWGTELCGVTIESPEVLLDGEVSETLILIFSGSWKEEILSQLSGMGFSIGKNIRFFREIANEVPAELYVDEFKLHFAEMFGKRIWIYNEGNIGLELERVLQKLPVMGIVSDTYLTGEIAGKPLVQWFEISEEVCDVVVIASPETEYQSIYRKILDKCLTLGIDIFGINGQNLLKQFGWNPFHLSEVVYCRKSEGELRRLIEQYDAISFDLFDTLIMRKTLLPTDVFDMVEDRLRTLRIPCLSFKAQRRAVEIAEGGTIHQIYEKLGKKFGWNDGQRQCALQTELELEKSVLLPRAKMVEMLRYASELGKRVSIISDMYLSADILDDLLKAMNITGYDKIYVSCDYGVGKSDGLFEYYLKDVRKSRCLHIGDNEQADVKAPLQYGIASYGIASALELFRMTNYRYVLSYCNTYNERCLLGLLLADILNNPFALHGSGGILALDNLPAVGKLFGAPVVIKYMLELRAYIQKNGSFDRIFFGARDGCLFQRVYENLRSTLWQGEEMPEGIYLPVSRKLCSRCTISVERDLDILIGYVANENPARVLTDMLGLPREKVELYKAEKHQNVSDYFLLYQGEVERKTSETRRKYLRYLEINQIDITGRNLFFDLASRGTVLYALNHIFETPLQGFFVMDYGEKNLPGIAVESVYQDMESPIYALHNFLEIIFSAKEPSLRDMGEGAELTYEQEKRTIEQIEAMEEMQGGIEDLVSEYFTVLYLNGSEVKKELAERLLAMCPETDYVGAAAIIRKIRLFDELGGRSYDIMERQP